MVRYPPLFRDVAELSDYIERIPIEARTDEQKIDDYEHAMRLLAGLTPDHKVSYLNQNSYEERLARAALARLVRDSMQGFVGELLALAIDPRTPSPIYGMYPTRKIRFESPARGKKAQWVRDLMIIDCILNDLHQFEDPPQPSRLKRAIATAAGRYGISFTRASEIWEQRGKLPRRRSDK
jgi:hypothetical protein